MMVVVDLGWRVCSWKKADQRLLCGDVGGRSLGEGDGN